MWFSNMFITMKNFCGTNTSTLQRVEGTFWRTMSILHSIDAHVQIQAETALGKISPRRV
jgi:hypothetical protein